MKDSYRHSILKSGKECRWVGDTRKKVHEEIAGKFPSINSEPMEVDKTSSRNRMTSVKWS